MEMQVSDFKPLARQVVVCMDPDESPSSIIARPDLDTIKYCKRCGNMMEALKEVKCHKKEIWGRDKNGMPVVEYIDQSHDGSSVQAPANPSNTRTGVITAVGELCSSEVEVGKRVIFHFASGRAIDEDAALYKEPEYRVIYESALLGEVCE